jgi:hypothetical protein
MIHCPHCHQPIQDERLGVRLTPLKCALIDRIKASGDIGIASTELVADLYRDRGPVQPAVIKAHVFQINDLLCATSYRICSDGRRWFLVKS